MTAPIISPDYGSTWQRVIEAVQVLTDARANFTANAANSYLNQESIIQSDGVYFDSDADTGFKGGLQSVRTAYATAIGSAQAMLNWALLEFSREIGHPQTSADAVLPYLYTYMAQGTGGSKSPTRVQSRNITYGSWSAGGSDVGNGTVIQLSVDQYALPYESGVCETMTFTCLADANSGTNPGQEQFDAQGQPFRDALNLYSSGFGSGISKGVGALIGITGDTTSSLIVNPSFANGSVSGGSLTLNNWTILSGATVLTIDTVYYYRACAIEGAAPASLKATGNFSITQTLGGRSGQLNQLLPYFTQLAVNGTIGTWVGSITITIGNLTWTINSGGSNWVLSQPTIGNGLYFPNFNAAGLAVTITGTVSSGFVNIDDFLWAPFTSIGGFYYAAVGGSTNWLVNDNGTITNTEGTAAKIQREFGESYGWSLPSNVQASAPAAPTVTPAAGGAVDVGYHGFAYSYYNSSTGVESPVSAITYATFPTGTQTADLTGVTTGPAGTTARYVYMTKRNNGVAQPVLYYAGSIANNAGTTINLSVADASLLLMPGAVLDPVN